jgi:hypothetical protein
VQSTVDSRGSGECSALLAMLEKCDRHDSKSKKSGSLSPMSFILPAPEYIFELPADGLEK